MATLRVVLDTNVLLSGTAYPGSAPGRIVAAWRQGGLEVTLSNFILAELLRVLPRLNHRLSWSAEDMRTYVDSLAFLADMVEPVSPQTNVLRDQNDLPILGTLLAAKADYLVTGDKDLLALADQYPVLTPSDFWNKHGG